MKYILKKIIDYIKFIQSIDLLKPIETREDLRKALIIFCFPLFLVFLSCTVILSKPLLLLFYPVFILLIFIEFLLDERFLSKIKIRLNTLSDQFNNTDYRFYNDKTIVGLLLLKKKRRYSKSYLLLVFWFIINSILSIVFSQLLALYLLIPTVVLYIILKVDQRITEFRIFNGYYGSNEFELKELLKFIIDETDKSQFIDKNGNPKEIINYQRLKSELILSIPPDIIGASSYE